MENLTTACSTAGEERFLELFCVQRGVPYDRVFEELSVLLGCIRDLTYRAEVERFAFAHVDSVPEFACQGAHQ
jgi:hypothetical protein